MTQEDGMKKYELVDSISTNENAEVSTAIKKSDKSEVVIKKIMRNGSGVREIKHQLGLSHESVVKMFEHFVDKISGKQMLVFERCEIDLLHLYNREPLEGVRIQKFLKQLLEGLNYIHSKNIIHRDIKTENLFITTEDNLKIGDFGLARLCNANVEATPQMVSLWFRPIEILLGSRKQTYVVDVWSAGCVMAELYRRGPIFKSHFELGVIFKICQVLGTPTEEEWPEMNEFPGMMNVQLNSEIGDKNNLALAVPNASESALDLMRLMFVCNPMKRIGVSDALRHEYFRSEDKSMTRRERKPPDFPKD